jgi:thiazole biosynthesis enzyme
MPPMDRIEDAEISKTILGTYHERLLDRVVSDVLIVGAGPAGMMAAIYLAQKGLKVTLLERRLSPGGGIWGGGMGMNVAVVQKQAVAILEELGIQCTPARAGLYAVDAVELAAGLCFSAKRTGVAIFNLMTAEDLCVHQGRATGVVANRTGIATAMPVDPIAFSAQAVLDATGHEAFLVQSLRKRQLLADACAAGQPGEGPMDASSGESFVVEHVGEVFPGLWVAGMSVAATLRGPRMGPIFGGMLLSGKRAAELIDSALKTSAVQSRWLL